MSLTIAVQMDPIERINIRGDSTFALLLEAQKRGHGIAYYTPDRLALRDARVFATVQPLKVRDQPGDHFTLGEPARMELAAFDVVLLRQDPPFDLAYITSTHMLERVHPKTLVVNDPAQVRNAPEKIFVLDFLDLMPPTIVTRSLDDVQAFRKEMGDVILKPLYGNGGAAIFRIGQDDTNAGALVELFQSVFREPFMVQQYHVELGERRASGLAEGTVIADLVADRERLHRRHHLLAVQRQPVRGVIGQRMAALLRLQQQREGGVALDIDPFDRIHLHGNIQAHRSPGTRLVWRVRSSAAQ